VIIQADYYQPLPARPDTTQLSASTITSPIQPFPALPSKDALGALTETLLSRRSGRSCRRETRPSGFSGPRSNRQLQAASHLRIQVRTSLEEPHVRALDELNRWGLIALQGAIPKIHLSFLPLSKTRERFGVEPYFVHLVHYPPLPNAPQAWWFFLPGKSHCFVFCAQVSEND
jgi:hypothetical protein